MFAFDGTMNFSRNAARLSEESRDAAYSFVAASAGNARLTPFDFDIVDLDGN